MYFSFLYFFKPLGLFLRLFGVFPCVHTNVKSAPLQVSKFSLSWALVVLIGTGVSSFLQMPPLLISKVLTLLSLILNMCIVPAVILNIKPILNFISKFQNFDENMKLCFRNKPGLNHGKYYTHIMICIYLLCSMVMVGIYSYSNNSEYGFVTIFVYFLDGSIRIVYINAFPFLIIFFLQEMKTRFRTYHNYFSSLLKKVSYNKIQLEWFLDNSRLLYFQLVATVDSFNDCFGSCLLILFLVQFLQILLSLHVMLTTITPFIFIYIMSNVLGYIISTLSGDLILCVSIYKIFILQRETNWFMP